jgi:hypothetical protein
MDDMHILIVALGVKTDQLCHWEGRHLVRADVGTGSTTALGLMEGKSQEEATKS